MPKLKPNVSDADLAELRDSGLSDATILRNRIRTEGEKLVYPFRDVNGEVNCYAVSKPHKPRKLGDKVIKYEQPAGEPARAYFPNDALPAIRSTTGPLLIVEGLKDSLCATQEGFAAIGLTGVWNWKVANSEELLPELTQIKWTGRTVYICFDYDPKVSTRHNVGHARRRLAEALKQQGADVRVMRLPPGPGGEKVGVDNFLVHRGPEAFRLLMEQAPAPNNVIKIISLPPAAYHGLTGEFLRLVAPLTEAPDPAVLAHWLPAVGTLLGPHRHVWAGGPQPARLNVAVVGRTNDGRKGTSFVPVNKLLQGVDAEFWANQRVSGLSSGEGLITKVADVWKTNEDGERELEVVEKRLFVQEPEFARVLANIRREGNILSHVIRESYDSGMLSTLTVTPRYARDAHISIVTHITPEELRLRLNHIEMANGFGNRFLWFVSTSDKLLPHTEPFPDNLFLNFEKRLRGLKGNAATESSPVLLDDEAKQLWEEMYPILRADRDGLAGAMTARGASHVLRIALVYCALDGPKQWLIKRVHLEAALAVWEYCEESAYMLFGGQTGDDLADKLLGLLAAGSMSRDDFNKHLSPNQKREATAALQRLEQSGRVKSTSIKHKGAGRPTTVWELVPQV